MEIFIDIETIPDQSEGALERVMATIEAPATMKKAETIADWHAGNGKYAGAKQEAAEEIYRKTGLSGTKGEIICISFALGTDDPFCIGRELGESEADLLEAFFVAVEDRKRDIDDEHCSAGGLTRVNSTLNWVGHYITGFDLRFFWQRCVINNVKPSIFIPYSAKPWDSNVFDTFVEWAGLHGKDGKLGDVCEAMGYAGKGDIDGSQVWDYIKAGRYTEVFDYCDDDVVKARLIFNRMNFIGE